MPQPVDQSAGAGRLIIPTCVGCHSLREYETCEAGCHERRCELVGGDQLDELINAASILRVGTETLMSPVRLLDRANPGPDELHSAYHAVQSAARNALCLAGLQASDLQLATPAQPIVVWRCEDCGAIDAMQPCLGVCVWRTVEWVDASVYAAQRMQLNSQLARATKMLSLVRRIAFATPRVGAWQRSWDSLHLEASVLLGEAPGAAWQSVTPETRGGA